MVHHRRLMSVGMLLGLVAAVAMTAPSAATAAGPSVGARPDVPVDSDVYTVPYRVHRYPAAAVDPANPAHIVEIDTDQAGIHCTAHASFDGGYTWTAGAVPLPVGWSICKQQGNDTSETPGQPAVAFGPDGTVYAVVRPTDAPASNPGTAAFAVAVSHDGGRTFAPLSFAFPTSSGPDTGNEAMADYLAVDATSGPRRGTIYVLSSGAVSFGVTAPSAGPQLSISHDGGRTFSAAQPVGTAPPNSELDCCAEMGISGQGELDVVAPFRPASGTSADCLPTSSSFSSSNGCIALVVYRSQDGGTTWSLPEPLYNQYVGSSSFAMGVDPVSGTVYAVIADPHTGNDGIWVASLPSGVGTATAVEVAHAPAGSDFAFPAGSATAGRFDFAYYLVHRGSAIIAEYDSTGKQTGTYDASQVPCTIYASGYGHYPGFGDTCPTNVYYGYTTDGTTFPLQQGQQINSATFDNLVGFEYGGDGNQVVLNGLTIVSTPGFARAFWTDSRNNADQSDGNQDQYSRCLPMVASACPVPAGFVAGRPPLTGIPGYTPTFGQGAVTSRQAFGRRVLRRDVYEPKPSFPPPLPGAPAVASPPIIRTVLAADQYVPLYIAAIVAAALALLLMLGVGMWRAYRWLVT